jgi:hypothetical protein
VSGADLGVDLTAFDVDGLQSPFDGSCRPAENNVGIDTSQHETRTVQTVGVASVDLEP